MKMMVGLGCRWSTSYPSGTFKLLTDHNYHQYVERCSEEHRFVLIIIRNFPHCCDAHPINRRDWAAGTELWHPFPSEVLCVCLWVSLSARPLLLILFWVFFPLVENVSNAKWSVIWKMCGLDGCRFGLRSEGDKMKTDVPQLYKQVLHY